MYGYTGTGGNAEIRGMINAIGLPTGAYNSEWSTAFNNVNKLNYFK